MRPYRAAGFSVLELLIAVVVIGVLVAIVIGVYLSALEHSRVVRAMAEIRSLEKEITAHATDSDLLPPSLATIGRDGMLDPWGHPYRYLPFRSGKPPKDGKKGPPPKPRKHKGPINADFDLYSVGADGRTTDRLDTRDGRDDVVRADDGAFVGLAADYVRDRR